VGEVEMTCETVRLLLPEVAAAGSGEWPTPLLQHLEACADCRREGDLIRLVLAQRPEPPPELAGRISLALRRELAAPAPSTRGKGGGLLRLLLPVAALLVAVVGSVLVQGGSGPEGFEGGVVAAANGTESELEGARLWPSGNGMVAGEPLLLLDGLTEEQLETLLAELDG
jgi:hypothetical protein